MVNKAMLSMLCSAFPGEVICYASKSAMSHLDTRGCLKIKYLYVNSVNGKLAVLLRYFTSTIYNIFILLSSHSDDLLFYNYNNVFSLKALDLINRFKKTKIIICCHGEMEFLSLKSSGSQLYKKIMSGLVRSYFNKDNRHPSNGMYFIVLSDVALKNIKPYLSEELYSRFFSIDHPVLSLGSQPYISRMSECGNVDRINLGTVGILNEHKGGSLYQQLIKKVNKKRHDICFHIIGHIQCDPEPFKALDVVIPEKTNEPLPDYLFLEKVNRLDFILYFYSSDKYRLTSSGALLDAIRFRKPVIALRNEYFEYFFKKYGELGYLVDSIDEMEDLIVNLNKLNRVFDFDGVAEKLSLENLQSQFNNIIVRLAQ